MKCAVHISNTDIQQKITYLHQEQFTGRLKVKSARGTTWKLYFLLGRLVWADGGDSPNRPWSVRQTKYCPQLNEQLPLLNKISSWECKNYQTLAVSLEKGAIELKQIKSLIQNQVEEILFDILQKESYARLEYICEPNSNSGKFAYMLKKPLVLINPEEALTTSQLCWSAWIQKGLGFWSPNLVVGAVRHSETVEKLSAIISKDLIDLIDGQNTLRDLAFLTEQNVEELTALLIPFVNEGILKFIEFKSEYKDETKSQTSTTNYINSAFEGRGNEEEASCLIVVIDDNLDVCQYLEKIIKKTGYEFISIQDSWQAVARVISYQPDLIILNENMPIVSGYEIVSQLRRVSHLKYVPIVMLKTSNNILSKLRTKLLGIDACITKPINPNKTIDLVNKILSKKKKKLYEKICR